MFSTDFFYDIFCIGTGKTPSQWKKQDELENQQFYGDVRNDQHHIKVPTSFRILKCSDFIFLNSCCVAKTSSSEYIYIYIYIYDLLKRSKRSSLINESFPQGFCQTKTF